MNLQKLYLALLLAVLHTNPSWSQDDLNTSIPTPSAMSTYQDIPVDYCTGIPDISYGLLSLPTASKNLSFNLSLNYHPNNATANCKVSDVGKGWSWHGIPTITKNLTAAHDEATLFSSITDTEWGRNVFDDIYYYNINGESGRFRFGYDYSTSTPSIKMLNTTQLKFNFVSTSTERLMVDSFQVTDTNGLVYNFGKYDLVKRASFSEIVGDRVSFHLTSVFDSNNTQLCSISYVEVYSAMASGVPHKIASINNIDEITANGVGKIKFDLTTTTSMINKYVHISKLNSISLLTLSNQQIRKCVFNRPGLFLEGIDFMGSNTAVVESYKFKYKKTNDTYYDGDLVLGNQLIRKYDRFGFVHITNRCSVADLVLPKPTSYSNPQTVTTDILQEVTLPTGGVVAYEFEANEIDPDGYQGLSQPNLLSTNSEDDFNEALLGAQVANPFALKPINPDSWTWYQQPREDYYLVNLGNYNYSVSPGDSGKFIQMTQDTELFVRFEGYANPSPLFPDGDPPIGFQIKQGNNVLITYMMHHEPNACVRVSPKIDLAAGWYTIHIVSSSGGGVDYTLYARRKGTNAKTFYYGGGVRIKSIKHYEGQNLTTAPLKSIAFEYGDFNVPGRSSGKLHPMGLGRSVDGHDGLSASVFYKNVRVSEDGNGYSKYYYYIFGDLEQEYYNILKDGLLCKKEVFNAQHSLIEAEKYYYEAKYSSTSLAYWNAWGRYGDASYIKRRYAKTEKYLSGTSPTVMKSVVINSTWNFKPESATTFDSRNKKLKTRYYYLNELPGAPHASSLTTKNILSEPHLVEQYYDGVLMSRAKSEYDSFGNGLFKKAKSYAAKGIGDYMLEQRVSKMDNMANKIQEVTNDKGSYTSYVWGYNKTYLVAKIENMAYATIPAGLISTVQNATNIANNEANILAALDALRNGLPNAMVTTYTYKPLVGIQSVTDPKGDKVTYHYDPFNRLVAVKDRNDNLLTENQYHFRPQN